MKRNGNLALFRQIEQQKSSDMIIEQIQTLISSGALKPGMKLPSERALAERFGVGRGPVRDSLRKLEFYGLVRTESHRGTFVAQIGEKALQGLISALLRGGNHDIAALFETREILEVRAAYLAAERSTPEDRALITRAHQEFERVIIAGSMALEEDHLFHLTIARSTKNPLLASLLGYLTPEIIITNRDASSREVSNIAKRRETLSEHEAIVSAIVGGHPDDAESAMRHHMDALKKRRLTEDESS